MVADTCTAAAHPTSAGAHPPQCGAGFGAWLVEGLAWQLGWLAMGCCSSTNRNRAEAYKAEPLPAYAYAEHRARLLATPVSHEDLLACRSQYPLPGTEKLYTLCGEPGHPPGGLHSRWEACAVVKDADTQQPRFRVRFVSGGRVVTLHRLAAPQEGEEGGSGADPSDWGAALGHLLLTPDGGSVEVLMGGRAIAVVHDVGASTSAPPPAFPWMPTSLAPNPEPFPGERLDAAVLLVPYTPAMAAPAKARAHPGGLRGAEEPPPTLRVVTHGSPGNEDVAFKYWGDIAVRADSSLPAATILVKHRRWGEGEDPSADDHLVLLLVGLAIYNTATPWDARLQ